MWMLLSRGLMCLIYHNCVDLLASIPSMGDILAACRWHTCFDRLIKTERNEL